jgi:DNA-binding response OmpR family regulator
MASKASILFVDDEDALRTLVKNQLVTEGYAVETADDGDTAIEMLGAGRYDVVLLDVRMPRVSGVEVLKFIREKKLSPRVVMLTAVDDLSVAIESVKLGANDYLTKPYDLTMLVNAIQRVTAK